MVADGFARTNTPFVGSLRITYMNTKE